MNDRENKKEDASKETSEEEQVLASEMTESLEKENGDQQNQDAEEKKRPVIKVKKREEEMIELVDQIEPEERKQNYELAYHLTPDFSPEELQRETEKIEKRIVTLGGTIEKTKSPEKMRLAYPINHKKFAHFGIIDFSAKKEIIALLSKELQFEAQVLRYLITARIEKKSPTKKKGTSKIRRERPLETKKLEGKEKPSETPEELDKQLEEILGKL